VTTGSEGTERFESAGFAWRARAGQRAVVDALCATLDDPGRIPGAECVKRNPAREVWRIPLSGRAVYLKRFRVRGLLEQLKYRVRPPRAEAEWRVAIALAAHGIAATPPIAVGLSRSGLRLTDGLFLADEVPGLPHSHAIESLRTRRGDAMPLVHATLALFRELVRAGVMHPDLHGGNLLVTLDGEAPKITLVDLHSIRLPRRLSSHARERMRAKLAHSMWRVLRPREYEVLMEGLAPDDRGRLEARVARVERERLASRSKRCLVSSSEFVKERASGWRIYRRREVAPAPLLEAAAKGPAEATAVQVDRSGEPHGALLRARSGASWLPEWKSLHALAVRDIPALRALACLVQRRFGSVQTSLLFLEPLPDALPLDRAPAEWQGPELEAAVCDVATRMHRHGLEPNASRLFVRPLDAGYEVRSGWIDGPISDQPLTRASESLARLRAHARGPHGN
jgi:hypothetical protein